MTPDRWHTLKTLFAEARALDAAARTAFLEDALALWREQGDEQGLATGLNTLAWIDCEISALNEAAARAEEARSICERLGDRRGEAVALNNLGWVAHYRGAFAGASRLHRESLALRQALGDQRGIAYARINAAWAETYRGRYDRAKDLLDAADDDVQAVGDVQECIWWLTVSGLLAWHQGDCDRVADWFDDGLGRWTVNHNASLRAVILGAQLADAAPVLNEAAAQWDTVGTPWGRAIAACERSRWALATGDPVRAADAIATSFALRQQVGDRHGLAQCLEAMARIAQTRGDAASATQLLAAAQVLRDTLGAPRPRPQQHAHERLLAHLEGALADRFEPVWAKGTALSIDKAGALLEPRSAS